MSRKRSSIAPRGIEMNYTAERRQNFMQTVLGKVHANEKGV